MTRGLVFRVSSVVLGAVALAAGTLAAIDLPGLKRLNPFLRHGGRAAVQSYAELPLSFEANRGQAAPRVRYLGRGEGYTVSLTGSGVDFSLAGPRSNHAETDRPFASAEASVAMELVGVDQSLEVWGEDLLPGVVNYIKGSDPAGWHTGIPTYGGVRYESVYPGIDLVFRGDRQALEYDFVLTPGADPGAIALRFDGAGSLRIDGDGDLVIPTSVGDLVHKSPLVYQDVDGERRRVAGEYRLNEDRVGFALGFYDPALPLVIDPVVLAFSTFLGGAGAETGQSIAVDGSGAAYVTGHTSGADFPSTPGAYDESHNGTFDAFVTKLSPAGSSLVYSTFMGGSANEIGYGIAVDGAGAAYVAGWTEDGTTDFPTTPGAFEESHNGDEDVFVAKLNPAGGSLAYSTFLGGTGVEFGHAIGVDTSGAAYVTGYTENAATDFPTSLGAFDTTPDGPFDAFVSKLDPSGASLGYSTFLGGSANDLGNGIAVDTSGAAYVTGSTDSVTGFPTTTGAFDETFNGADDAFVTKVNSAGDDLTYSTFLGGPGGSDFGRSIAIDTSGAVFVTGETGSADGFPTTGGAFDTSPNGSFDAFVTKLGPTGAAPLVYSTFLGGSGFDIAFAIAVDGAGAVYVTGRTPDDVTDFPTTTGSFDETHNGSDDVFVTKIGPSGAAPLSYSTFLGGTGLDIGYGIAVDAVGAAYATGTTPDVATDFPTTTGAYDGTHNGSNDVFVTKLVEPPALSPPPPPLVPPETCKGKTATLTGTDAGETIRGTSGADVITALEGNDVVKAQGGNDLVCAGNGNDTANGAGGKDRLFGEDGKDTLKGGSANDKIKGGGGKDTCAGGSGDKDKAGCEKEKSIP